jgi:hypothetical protein
MEEARKGEPRASTEICLNIFMVWVGAKGWMRKQTDQGPENGVSIPHPTILCKESGILNSDWPCQATVNVDLSSWYTYLPRAS